MPAQTSWACPHTGKITTIGCLSIALTVSHTHTPPQPIVVVLPNLTPRTIGYKG